MGVIFDFDDEYFFYGIFFCLDDVVQEGVMCYVMIFDGSGKFIMVEVFREIYQVFVDYECEMECQCKEEYCYQGLFFLLFVFVCRKGQYMDGFIFIYMVGILLKKVWYRLCCFKII